MNKISIEEARRALKFARRHDWGQGAELSPCGQYIEGLTDTYIDETGTPDSNDARAPATIEALRKFGGY